MRHFLFAIILFLAISSCVSDPNKETLKDELSPPELTLNYDSVMAKEMGADPYGMRKFVMAFLKRGPNRDQDSVTAATIQRGHLDNMKVWAEAGKLVLAGPFFDNQDVRGIYIFAVDSKEEAEELVRTDPAIASGRLTMELREWYGSAALMKINEIHKQISKEDI